MVKLEFNNISLFRAEKIINPAKTEAEQRQNQKVLLARVAKIRGYEIAFRAKYGDLLQFNFEGRPLTIGDFVTMLGKAAPHITKSSKFSQMNEVFSLLELVENSTLWEARTKIWNLLSETSEQIQAKAVSEFENPEVLVQLVDEVASISTTFRYMFRFLEPPTKQNKHFNLTEFLETLHRKNQRKNKDEISKKH